MAWARVKVSWHSTIPIFFEVTPQSEADNVSEEITTVTPPQLNLSGSDNSQCGFYRYKPTLLAKRI